MTDKELEVVVVPVGWRIHRGGASTVFFSSPEDRSRKRVKSTEWRLNSGFGLAFRIGMTAVMNSAL